MYVGPRQCDCGCRRPAFFLLPAQDLAFSEKCMEKYEEAAIAFWTSIPGSIPNS